MPHVLWRVAWILSNVGHHASLCHGSWIHALRQVHAWGTPMHLIRPHGCLLLGHRRRHHSLGMRLRPVWRSACILTRPLWCLSGHAILANTNCSVCRRDMGRLRCLHSLRDNASIRSPWTLDRWRGFVWPRPDIVENLLAVLPVLFEPLVVLCGLSGLVQDLPRRRGPRDILIRHAGQLMTRTLNASVVSRLQVGGRPLLKRFWVR